MPLLKWTVFRTLWGGDGKAFGCPPRTYDDETKCKLGSPFWGESVSCRGGHAEVAYR
jgi:hypothetical protein